jgi:hypothetical protein
MLENTLVETCSLNGEWEIEIAGERGAIQVPGAWEVQGYPDLEGPAVYRRTFDLPVGWQDTPVMVRFGAVSYYVAVYVNGVCVGTHEGLWTPFTFDITEQVRFGINNTLELHITKPADEGDRFPYRDVLVGFIPYVSTTFGGIWQDVELVSHRAPAFRAVQIAADSGQVKVQFEIDRVPEMPSEVIAEISSEGGEIAASTALPLRAGVMTVALSVIQPAQWSPASPHLYTLTLRMVQHGETVARTQRRFGFRHLHTNGEQLLLNGEPIFLRGVLSWGWNPKTLAPIFTDDEIRAEFRRARELGFNLYKLCLYVPPPRLFEIADEMGMLLWLEMPMWLPRLSDHLRQQAEREYADILARVHHHASIVIYSLGCELSADMADAALLETLDGMTRRSTCGALVCDNSGSGEAYGGLARDFADFNDYHFYAELHYFTPLCDYFRRDWRPSRPWIFGEFCDCDDYRDPAAILDGGQRAWWRDLLGKDGGLHRWAYKEQEQRVEAHQLGFSHAQLAQISRQQSFLVRKTILEKVRARRDIGGYVVTGLRDTPISSSGVFDDAGEAKYAPDAFTAFNADTVLLLEQGRARIWKNGGDRPAPADRFNHEAGSYASFRALLAAGERAVSAGELVWQFTDMLHGQIHAQGQVQVGHAPAGSLRELAMIEFQMPEVQQAAQYRLTFALRGAELVNEWQMWVYPAASLDQVVVFDPAGILQGIETRVSRFVPTAPHTMASGEVLLTTVFTPEVEAFVRSGGSAIVLQPGAGALPVKAIPFWRESIRLLYDHPILFPHQGYTDMQFYHLATDHAFDTQALQDQLNPATLSPILRRLDARLFYITEYLVEAQMGAGKMLASTLRFCGGSGDQVQGLDRNTAGRYLLSRMAAYLTGSISHSSQQTQIMF